MYLIRIIGVSLGQDNLRYQEPFPGLVYFMVFVIFMVNIFFASLRFWGLVWVRGVEVVESEIRSTSGLWPFAQDDNMGGHCDRGV
jgi:hypothetical protein